MNQEDKELLLKDLSARLPYGVLLHCNTLDTEERLFGINLLNVETEYTDARPIISVDEEGQEGCYSLDEIKPYLRPMSDITKDEFHYLNKRGLTISSISSVAEIETKFDMIEIIDFCNTNHLDYRGLISKGLALEALEGMYKL